MGSFSAMTREERAEYRRAWRAAHPGYDNEWFAKSESDKRKRRYREGDKGRAERLKKYNMTVEQYDAMLAAQEGRCLICRTDSPGGRWGVFNIDHDHSCCPVPPSRTYKTCGECTRGLLCNGCNVGLGVFNNDPNLLRAAADFLENAVQV